MDWLRVTDVISWPAAAAGAFLGTFSHVLFDSVMHAEMHPLWPFAEGNALIDAVSMKSLYLLFLGAGVVGALGLGVRYWVVDRGAGGKGLGRGR